MKNKIYAWLYLENLKEVRFFLLFIILYFTLRSVLAHYLLPYYSVDENEVVESAAAFIVGDMDPRFYKYGFLMSYILAVIYKIYAIILSIFSSSYIDAESVLYGVYFERYDYYYMARFLQSIFNFFSIVLIYRIANLYFNKRIAWFILGIMLIPIMEYHVIYTVRVDSALAFCFVLITYNYLRYIENQKEKYLILMFVSLALAFSAKPMPALFSFIVLVYPFIKTNEKVKFIGKFLLTFFLVSLVVNPYFILKFKAFYDYNYNALFGFQIGSKEMQSYSYGYQFFWIQKYGLIFSLTTLLSLIFYIYTVISSDVYSKNKKILLNILLIPITYIFCFSMFNTRFYWFTIVFPFIFFLWAFLFIELSKKYKLKAVVFYPLSVFVSVVALLPVFDSIIGTMNNILFKEVGMIRFTEEAKKIIPNRANIFFIGFHTRSPLLFHSDINKEAQKGQYFMYHRGENKGYVQHFVKAHKDYTSKNRTYNLISAGGRYYDTFKGDKNENLIYKDLVKFCKKNRVEYIMATSHNKEHTSDWETNQDVKKILDSNELGVSVYGPHTKLFRIKLN